MQCNSHPYRKLFCRQVPLLKNPTICTFTQTTIVQGNEVLQNTHGYDWLFPPLWRDILISKLTNKSPLKSTNFFVFIIVVLPNRSPKALDKPDIKAEI